MPRSDDGRQREPLRRVGALWKPRAGTRSLGSGWIAINGLRQRFLILPNDRQRPDRRDPDFVLMASEPPALDEHTHRPATNSNTPAPARTVTRDADPFDDVDEGIGF